jgi:hypothetical protein
MSPTTCGHPRALLVNAERRICRTNALANDRACAGVTLTILHGKEGVSGSSPEEGSAKASLARSFLVQRGCFSSNVPWYGALNGAFRKERPAFAGLSFLNSRCAVYGPKQNVDA